MLMSRMSVFCNYVIYAIMFAFCQDMYAHSAQWRLHFIKFSNTCQQIKPSSFFNEVSFTKNELIANVEEETLIDSTNNEQGKEQYPENKNRRNIDKVNIIN